MKKALALGMAAVMAAGLVACGKPASSNTPASGSTSNSGSTGSTTSTGALNTDTSTMYIWMASEPDSLDPALNSTVDGGCLAANSFMGLYTYNEKGEIVPALATDVQVSEDGLTYTFTVPESKWSNGDPLTAADFEYSWKRAASNKTGASYGYLFAMFDGYDGGEGEINVKAEGDKLTCVLNNPTPYFLELMAFPTFMPVHKDSVEAADPDGTSPKAWVAEAGFVSNGAFTCTEWKHNESMTYTKNPYFYRADDVKLEKLQIMLSSDDTATYAAYTAGNLDFIESVPVDETPKVKNNSDYYVADSIGTVYSCFDVTSDLFKDKTPQQAADMRHAINILIDRQYIVDTVGLADQVLADSFVPKGMKDGNGEEFWEQDRYFDADGISQNYDETLDEARKLLENAGYKFGDDGMLSPETPLTINYTTNNSESLVKMAECIQQDLGALGIEMKLEEQEWQVFLNERKAGNYDMARNGWIADYSDPIGMLEMWLPNSGNNDIQLGRDGSGKQEAGTPPAWAPDWTEYTNLINAIYAETDTAKRAEMMHQAEDMLMDTWTIVPIYYYNDPYMLKGNITGVYSTVTNMKYFMYAEKFETEQAGNHETVVDENVSGGDSSAADSTASDSTASDSTASDSTAA